MEFLQLKYFVSLANNQHLTRTAQEFLVTPSAVSIAIARLETEFDVKLFNRVGRNIYLNEYGIAFLPYAEAVLQNAEDGAACLADMKHRNAAHLTLAVWNAQTWHSVIQAFHHAYPEISITQVTYDPIASPDERLAQDVDLVISSSDSFQKPDWEGTCLFEDKILLAVSADHALASRQSIDLAEVKDEHFCSTGNDSFNKRCREMCRAAGFSMRTAITCDYTLRPKIIQSEKMLAFVTYHGILTGHYDNAHFIQIDSPSDVRLQYLWWRKARYQSKAIRTAKSFFINYYRNFTAGQFL